MVSKVAGRCQSVICCVMPAWCALTAACERQQPQRIANCLPGVCLCNTCLCEGGGEGKAGLPFKHRNPGIFLQVEVQNFYGRLLVRRWEDIKIRIKIKVCPMAAMHQLHAGPCTCIHPTYMLAVMFLRLASLKHVVPTPPRFRKRHAAHVAVSGMFGGGRNPMLLTLIRSQATELRGPQVKKQLCESTCQWVRGGEQRAGRIIAFV